MNVIRHINNIREEKHTIVSVGAEKAFDTIEHTLTIKKKLNKVDIEEIYLNKINLSS